MSVLQSAEDIVVAACAGSEYTVAVTSAGDVFAWGDNTVSLLRMLLGAYL